MRTTLRIDDDLLRELRDLARQGNRPVTDVVNAVLRRGLQASAAPPPARAAYREQVYSLGEPKVSLDKALALAGTLEDVRLDSATSRAETPPSPVATTR